MFKRGYIIITTILSLVSVKSQAQYDVSFSHYFDMEPSFNAAAVGKSPKLNIAAAYAMELAGFKRNPNTMYAGADAQFLLLKQFHGAGIQLMNDQIGLFSHKRLALQYAFKFKLFGGQLSTGISAGLLSESFDGTKVDLEESNDPAFSSSKIEGNSLDLAAGLYYSHRNWYVGISAQHLNSPCVQLGETNELQVDATYYLTGGATIRLRNPFLSIQPSFSFAPTSRAIVATSLVASPTPTRRRCSTPDSATPRQYPQRYSSAANSMASYSATHTRYTPRLSTPATEATRYS